VTPTRKTVKPAIQVGKSFLSTLGGRKEMRVVAKEQTILVPRNLHRHHSSCILVPDGHKTRSCHDDLACTGERSSTLAQKRKPSERVTSSIEGLAHPGMQCSASVVAKRYKHTHENKIHGKSQTWRLLMLFSPTTI